MSIYRIARRENPYVQIDHRVLEDERLSWRAKGLLAYLLSKPVDWQIVSEDLLKKSTDGRESIQSAMRELRDCGYATLEVMKEGTLLRGKKWHVHENGFCRQTGKPTVGESTPSNKDPDSNKEKTTKKESVRSAVMIPNELDCPEFLEAWERWRLFRKEIKKPHTFDAMRLQLKDLEAWGKVAAVISINESIKARWTGLFAPKNGIPVAIPKKVEYRSAGSIPEPDFDALPSGPLDRKSVSGQALSQGKK